MARELSVFCLFSDMALESVERTFTLRTALFKYKPTVSQLTNEETVEDMKVTMVDISGVYVETMGGPFSGGKKVENPDFRVLAAIVQTPESGNYFVKLIGPKATIGANEKAFGEAIKGIKLKE